MQNSWRLQSLPAVLMATAHAWHPCTASMHDHAQAPPPSSAPNRKSAPTSTSFHPFRLDHESLLRVDADFLRLPSALGSVASPSAFAGLHVKHVEFIMTQQRSSQARVLELVVQMNGTYFRFLSIACNQANLQVTAALLVCGNWHYNRLQRLQSGLV